MYETSKPRRNHKFYGGEGGGCSQRMKHMGHPSVTAATWKGCRYAAEATDEPTNEH